MQKIKKIINIETISLSLSILSFILWLLTSNCILPYSTFELCNIILLSAITIFVMKLLIKVHLGLFTNLIALVIFLLSSFPLINLIYTKLVIILSIYKVQSSMLTRTGEGLCMLFLIFSIILIAFIEARGWLIRLLNFLVIILFIILFIFGLRCGNLGSYILYGAIFNGVITFSTNRKKFLL